MATACQFFAATFLLSIYKINGAPTTKCPTETNSDYKCALIRGNLPNYFQGETKQMLSTNSELQEKLSSNICQLTPENSCAIQTGSFNDITNLEKFSNFLIESLPATFLGGVSTDIILSELSNQNRSSEAKVKLIELVKADDILKLVGSIEPITRAEALAVLQKVQLLINLLNPHSYNQMQLILTKGFHYDQLDLFFDQYQFIMYLENLLNGIESGFMENKLTCFESNRILQKATELLGELKQSKRYNSDYKEKYSVWIKLWGQILPCVGPDQVQLNHNRQSQIVDSILRYNPKAENFDYLMGSLLLKLFLQEAPFINSINGENSAFDSVSHLWEHANFEHALYIQGAYLPSPSLKSETTLKNMLTLPKSSVFIAKVSQVVCKNSEELHCLPFLTSETRKGVIIAKKFETKAIPVNLLSSQARFETADLIYSNQQFGISLSDKLKALGDLACGLPSLQLADFVKKSSSDSKETSKYIYEKIHDNPNLFSEQQKAVFVNSLAATSPDQSTSLEPHLWMVSSFENFRNVAEKISKVNLDSAVDNFLNKKWNSLQADILTKSFGLSLNERISLAQKSGGSWVSPKEVDDMFLMSSTYELFRIASENQSKEFHRSVAEKLVKRYETKYQRDYFLLNFVEEPIAASIPGYILRELPLASFEGARHCRDMIAKIGQLKDNHGIPKGRRQKWAELFLTNCESAQNQGFIKEDMLYSLGNLVCSLSPNTILYKIPTNVLQNSLSLFEQCILSQNQSLAIKLNLEKDTSLAPLNYLPALKNAFCLIFDFHYNTSQLLLPGASLKSSNRVLAALYEVVNTGGFFGSSADSFPRIDEMTISVSQEAKYSECYENMTNMVSDIEGDLTCDTLKILGNGLKLIDAEGLSNLPLAEVSKCLDYLGTDSAPDLMTKAQQLHILQILSDNNQLKNEKLVRLKNFIPVLATHYSELQFSVETTDLDSLFKIMDQTLEYSEITWLKTQISFPFESKLQLEKEPSDEILLANIYATGSAICFHHKDLLSKVSSRNITRFLRAIAFVSRNCPYSQLEQFMIMEKLSRANVSIFEPTVVNELGVFGALLFSPSMVTQLITNSGVIPFIDTSALEKIPASALPKLPLEFLTHFTHSQALAVLGRKEKLYDNKMSALLETIHSSGDISSSKDSLDLEENPADIFDNNKVPEIGSRNITRPTLTYQLIYVYSFAQELKFSLFSVLPFFAVRYFL